LWNAKGRNPNAAAEALGFANRNMPNTLVVTIHRQARQDHLWHRVLRDAFGHSTNRLVSRRTQPSRHGLESNSRSFGLALTGWSSAA
jgi:hypothetical protein